MVDQEQLLENSQEADQSIIDPQPRPTVLVVDDEPRILTSMTALLEDDFTVLTSTSAEKALGLLDQEQISVIIADQRMPGLTGDEFLAKAKNLSAATRILITGYADINALIRAVNHGQIYTYIAKPWEPAELRLAVLKAAEHCILSKEVERERSLLHALMDNIPDAIWFKDNACRFTQMNQATASLLGVSDPSEAIGRTNFDFLPWEEATERHAQEREIIRVGRAEANRIEELHFNRGEARWVSTTRAPVLERTGDVAAIVGISRDVTEQRQAEIALQQSEKKYKQIVETAAEGVWILDDHLRTVFVNQTMAAMLGHTPEEMVGKVVSHFMPPEDALVQLEHFRWTNSGRSVGDLRLRKKDGTLAWAMLSSSPMIDASGRQCGTLAMLNDVTQRRELEQRFLQAQKMEVVGRLAAGIAHDFNNLLTVINTYSQLLLGRLNEEDPAWREIHEIHSAGERSATLTKRLLAMGREPAQQPRLFDLNMVLETLQHMLTRLIGEEIRLTMRLDPGTCPIEADQEQIEHIVINLSINARDAMPRGGELVVTTANRRLDGAEALALGLAHGEYVELTVTDTGHGMDEQTKAKIFEAFFTTKEIGKGTGLGLWMARQVIQRSHGSLTVESTQGQGSSFRIYLPLAAKRSESAPVPFSEPEASNNLQTVLVIEDDPSAPLIKEFLVSAGYQVLSEREERVASLTARREIHIDLLISSLGTHTQGEDPITRLAAGRPDMKLLFLFNGDEIVVHEETWQPGVAYLQRPFQRDDLIQRVREVLETPSEYSILVTDDDPAIRNLLRDVLQPAGHRVLEASSGRQAIQKLRQEPVDLLITDLVMPEQEGLETIRVARKERPGLKIIAMSGGFGEKYLELAKALGADEILHKPFRLEAFRETVHRLAATTKVSNANG